MLYFYVVLEHGEYSVTIKKKDIYQSLGKAKLQARKLLAYFR